jgi:hypothetical protein
MYDWRPFWKASIPIMSASIRMSDAPFEYLQIDRKDALSIHVRPLCNCMDTCFVHKKSTYEMASKISLTSAEFLHSTSIG